MTKKHKSSAAKSITELVLAAWLLVINILYYAQFRELFLAHLPAWLRR